MKRVVCAGIFIASVAALAGCGVRKESYLAKGNQLFAAGRYEDASLNYRKAIQKDVNYGEAYYHLGLTAIKLDQGVMAYQALLRAVQLLPDNDAAKEQYADVCLSFYLADSSHPQALYTQISKLSDELLSKNGNSYEGLMLRGYLAATDRKPTEAIDFFRKALRINPSNTGVETELVHLLLQNGDVRGGQELAMDLITRQKTTYGPLYDQMYDFYLEAHRVSDAENVLQAKVRNKPREADCILQLARHYNRLQKSAEMQATLGRLLDNPAVFPAARLQVGDFYLGLRDYATALSYYQKGLDANPNATVKVAYQKRAVAALLGQGNRDEAASLAGQLVKENPKDDEALHLHAGILLDSGHRENAEVAVRELQLLSSRKPGDAPLLFQLGQAYRLQGNLSAARDQFVESIKRQKDLAAARYELAEISLIQQRPAEALQQANKILELRPKDRRAKLLRTASLIANGDGTAARIELTQLISQFPRDTEPRLQLGLLEIAERKYADAIDLLGKYRGRGDARVYNGLADAYLRLKQYDKAREVIHEGLTSQPDSPMLQQRLADAEALAGEYEAAIDHLQKLLSRDPKSVALRRRMAEVYELKGDHGNEIVFYRQACELAPDDLAAALGLADALARGGRTNEARVEFQRLVKMHPENAPTLNNAAFFLADTGGDLDEALQLARRALAQAPGQPGFSDTVGFIYLKKGLNDSAIQTFSNLARKYPYPVFRYHLGLALYVKGDKTAARKELQAALSGNPSREDKARIRELLQKIS
ncbi:MAG TPA: tetratricopeptide repeat protein [Bryobacteraceae bacterium]|jgi:tetratricopeptide (TPR) repeat protein|nr:tetratricopeptide repeat protein [Bryobacteraceae bacterium]